MKAEYHLQGTLALSVCMPVILLLDFFVKCRCLLADLCGFGKHQAHPSTIILDILKSLQGDCTP